MWDSHNGMVWRKPHEHYIHRHIHLGHEAPALAGTIGAAIIVGVLGLPPTAITWCGAGEPITFGKAKLINPQVQCKASLYGKCYSKR